MKKTFVFIISLFCLFFSFGQYQRMLIPKSQSPIVLKPWGKKNVESICLDYILDIPNESSDFTKILSNSDAVIVTYTKTGETKFLSEVLGKDVLIEGIGEGSYKHVKFRSNTDEELKITFSDIFQLGDGNQTEATVYSSTDQFEQWDSELDVKCKEMGFNNFANYVIHHTINKPELVEYVLEFGLSEEDLFELIVYNYKQTQKQFKNYYTNFRIKQNKQKEIEDQKMIENKKKRKDHEKRIEKAFKNANIGINGNAKKIITEYKKATGKDITRKNILKTLESHIKKKYPEYYILDEEGNYITYYKTNRISGMLYKKSRYVTHYLEELEEVLFAKELNKSNLEIVNFITKEHDLGTYNIINGYFKTNNTNFSLPNLIKLKAKIRQNQIKYIVFYGHFEGDELCQYVNGERLTYSIEYLRELAKDLKVKAIFAGCSTSISSLGEVSGFTEDMNSLDLAEILFKSLNDATSLGGFLKEMAGNSDKYTFTFVYDNEKEIIRVKFKKKKKEREKEKEYKESVKADTIIIEFSPQDFLKELTKKIIEELIPEDEHKKKDANE